LNTDRGERLTSLFDAHADSVFNVAWRTLWSVADAEDVTQTTFLRAFSRIDQLRQPDRARPWLLQIAYHSALEVLRRRRDVPTDPAMLPDRSTDESPESATIRSETLASLNRAIDALPETLRIAFLLRDVEGLSTNEVAAALGVGESAAKMRVSSAREQLRQTLEGLL
jgi:RNA polymerase sigma-70 factor (ECF subfamily)